MRTWDNEYFYSDDCDCTQCKITRYHARAAEPGFHPVGKDNPPNLDVPATQQICKWCNRPAADRDNVCKICRTQMESMSNCVRGDECPVGCVNETPLETLKKVVNERRTYTNGVSYHGVVNLKFAKLAEELSNKLLHELGIGIPIETEMMLAVALQNVATQAVRDALEPDTILPVLYEHTSLAMDSAEDRRALANALYKELLDRWRKRP